MPRVKHIEPDLQECFQQYLEDKHFTVKEAARILRVVPGTLQKKRVNKTGPKYIKTGHRSVVYTAKDLMEYMKERHYFSTSEDPTLLPQPKEKQEAQSTSTQLPKMTTCNFNEQKG